MLDQLVQYVDYWFDMCQFEVFVGLVGIGDVVGVEDQGFVVQVLEVWCFGIECYGFGVMFGQVFGDVYQFVVLCLFEWWYGREQWLVVDVYFVLFGQWLQVLVDCFV